MHKCRLYRSSFRGYFLILSLLGSILVLAVRMDLFICMSFRMDLFICMIFNRGNGHQLSKLHLVTVDFYIPTTTRTMRICDLVVMKTVRRFGGPVLQRWKLFTYRRPEGYTDHHSEDTF